MVAMSQKSGHFIASTLSALSIRNVAVFSKVGKTIHLGPYFRTFLYLLCVAVMFFDFLGNNNKSTHGL